MPDDWENVRALNPAENGGDGKAIAVSGYSNLEEYLNWLTQPHAFVAKNTPGLPTSVTLDLRPYIAGFPADAGHAFRRHRRHGIGGQWRGDVYSGGEYVWHRRLHLQRRQRRLHLHQNGRHSGIAQSAAAHPALEGDGTANAWNTTAANWTNVSTGAVTAFASGDRVLLDDTGSSTPVITLTGVVAPGSMEKTAGTKAFTLGGSGSLSGAMALSVSGAPLTIQNSAANSWAGGTFIEEAPR